jgi:four helix bundle protein
MLFDHEKLDVYRISIEFTAWAFNLAKKLSGQNRHARDQLLRASQSIPQNIAEGNGKRSIKDRKRFFEIARGSAMECASILDILLVCDSIPETEIHFGKKLLHRIVAMLSKMTEP